MYLIAAVLVFRALRQRRQGWQDFARTALEPSPAVEGPG
jgi:hypothetical protein